MIDARFIDFSVVEVPDLAESLTKLRADLPGAGAKVDPRSLLVLFEQDAADIDFLHNILKAAGYEEPDEQAWLLAWPEGKDLDLAALARHLGAQQIMIFGLSLPPLGLHLQLAPYTAVQLADKWYLSADSLQAIQAAKAAGQTAKAGALWKAIKSHFLYSTSA